MYIYIYIFGGGGSWFPFVLVCSFCLSFHLLLFFIICAVLMYTLYFIFIFILLLLRKCALKLQTLSRCENPETDSRDHYCLELL